MKRTITLLLLCLGFSTARAQWSNTTNQFYDSLDMPVAQAANDQKNAIIVKSESDGGYFVIWEDYRNAVNSADIYAQKYDKDGNRLWAVNGVPVATGETDQRYSYTNNSSLNFRNYSHAAADGAGGFYITWRDYVSSYSRVSVQHVRSTGTRVFGDIGYVVGDPSTNTGKEYVSPQLIADGLDGFFIGYGEVPLQQSGMNVYVYDYKDENGTLKQNGGGHMNAYMGIQGEYYYCSVNGTGGYLNTLTVANSSALATEYAICPDGQNGCNVVMAAWANSQQGVPGFNRLCRVKKDSHVKDVGFFKKDSVVRLYSSYLNYNKIDCSDPTVPCSTPGGCSVEMNIWSVINQGFRNLLAGESPYDVNYPGGGRFVNTVYAMDHINAALLTRDGDGDININALLITWNQRDLVGSSSLSNWTTRSYTLAQEIYDSLPYQLCTPNSSSAYSVEIHNRPAEMNKLNEGQSDMDTLISTLYSSTYDYALAASGNKAFMATLGYGNSYSAPVFYQELNFSRQSANSFALKINTSSKNGIIIGAGIHNNTSSDYPPAFAVDGQGNALFYYGQYHSYLQASPVGEGGKMLWGSMGIPLSPDLWQGYYTTPDAPFAYMDKNGKAIIAWQDSRQLSDGTSSSNNIYVRHLDSLLKPEYYPPLRVQLLGSNTYYANRGTTQNMQGSSNAWTMFQAGVYYSALGINDYTPVALIRDDYDLGTVTVSAQDYIGSPLRKTTDGKFYLNRNYTINVTNHPSDASIGVRLIFTKAEFDSLKAHESSIEDPGDLSVIKQPSTGTNAPATYTPSADDKGIKPIGWAAIQTMIAGETITTGYYIEIEVSDFSNFFVFAGESTLPVAFGSFSASAVGRTALLQWQTATETGNDHFDVQRSADGKAFATIGKVAGHGTTTTPQDYRFTDPAPLDGTNYYRLSQVDLDGRSTLSPVQQLRFGGKGGLRVSPNPVRGLLHVVLPAAAAAGATIEVYDLTGRKVLQQRVAAGSLTQEVDFTTLSAATYVLHYGQESVKVVKQ